MIIFYFEAVCASSPTIIVVVKKAKRDEFKEKIIILIQIKKTRVVACSCRYSSGYDSIIFNCPLAYLQPSLLINFSSKEHNQK